jgi:hypothetical protein
MRAFRRQPPTNGQPTTAFYGRTPPLRVLDVVVFDTEPSWVSTGLLDADGTPMQVLLGGLPNPVGFLHDAPRGRS